jgi:hypothetical protein
LHGAGANGSGLAGQKGESESVVAGGGDGVGAGVVRVQLIAQGSGFIRRQAGDAKDLGIIRIGLDDGGRDVGLLELGLKADEVVVGDGADSFLDHDLEDEVGAAAKIEAEVDAVGEGLQQGTASEAFGNANGAEDTEQEDSENENGFTREIFLHLRETRLLGIFLRGDGGDG